jgi:Protein of unknown function (DUF3025)
LRTPAGSIWTPEIFDSSPAFEALRPAARRLGFTEWPGIKRLNGAFAFAGIATGDGCPARLVLPGTHSTAAYEERAFGTGEILHREHDWHDLFNALVWLTLPRAKAALNARHVEELEQEMPGQRGRVRDALTLLDEDGVIVASSDRELLALIKEFRWKELFWVRRADVKACMRFVIFGHGLYGKARAPFLGMTGRAVLMLIDKKVFEMPLAERLAVLDTKLAEMLEAPDVIRTPPDLSPVPILGVPGWVPANRDEAFYENVDYFRPGRVQASAIK